MMVKVGDIIYDAEEEPIMIIMTDEDKDNISNMAPDAHKYCVYPDGIDEDEIKAWMDTTDLEEFLKSLEEEDLELEFDLDGMELEIDDEMEE